MLEGGVALKDPEGARQVLPERKRFRSKLPSEFQERLLEALRRQQPLSCGELSQQVGMTANEVRGYCLWLHQEGFILRTQRVVRRQAFGRSVRRLENFFTITEKGVQHLLSRESPAREAIVTDSPQSHEPAVRSGLVG